jgi:hypothetical protein
MQAAIASMDSLTDEIWLIFIKTDKIGPDHFVDSPKIDRLNLIFSKKLKILK